MAKDKKFHNYHDEGKALFVTFANKHNLKFVEEKNPYEEVFLVFPKQDNLRFKLTLGMQNGDEANIGIEDFWSYIFPYPNNIEYLNETLDGLVRGTHCIAQFSQFDRVTKLCLLNENNEIIYTDIKKLKLPFFGEKITKITSNKKET